ncbi:unnamed protein product [Clonostachys rosea f. rosea IK726]|uniref:Cytochrome P450 n=2 Tax=Bionectria ochroleuca TaxID=29856 RepID=A0A0B7JZH6_BIOOC|nr:unnamed protein product [Clonostachys rosea f. rosea IK726]
MDNTLIYGLAGVSSVLIVAMIWRALYPKPYPGIPYNEEAANRILGDIPDLMAVINETQEFSHALFAVTTQKLGVPIAQILFPGVRKPLVIVEDPREIEDIVLRRNREFDKAPMGVDAFQPMFPHSTVSQFTTPELKAQKRLWADVMSTEFLRKTAASNMHQSTLEMLDLWRLKASTIYKDKPFNTADDFANATLDVIWIALVGETAGLTKFEIEKLQNEVDGKSIEHLDLPRGAFVKEEIHYVAEAITRNSNSPSPKWAQRLEMLTPRYRKFRATVTHEINLAMRKALDRFERLEVGSLEDGEEDTCMMDLVLRRRVMEARKANREMTDPSKDENILDEMFTMLVGGHDSTSSALTWFVKFMEAYPVAQTELRAKLREAFPGPELPSAQEILVTNVPYLDAACEEGFRLAGVTKANLRQAVVDTQILGCPIPKGTEIFMNFHINHTPAPADETKRTAGAKAAVAKNGNGFESRAGRDLGNFEPRRWLVQDETTGKETFNPTALPSLAFGGGYRGCTGRKLAYMEFRIVVTLIILSFEFLELPEELKTFSCKERIFRRPNTPHAKLKIM